MQTRLTAVSKESILVFVGQGSEFVRSIGRAKKRRSRAALALSAALAFCAFRSPAAHAQSEPVAIVSAADAKSEVSASVYYMTTVVEALSRDFDGKLKAKTKQVEALTVRLNAAQTQSAAERAKLRAELARVQDDVVAQLAARDEQLARQVIAFRQDVQAIAATSEGLEALRLFNAQQWTAADAIMKRIVETVDKAEALASALRKAAPRRQRAQLAYEARQRGQATTKQAVKPLA